MCVCVHARRVVESLVGTRSVRRRRRLSLMCFRIEICDLWRVLFQNGANVGRLGNVKRKM